MGHVYMLKSKGQSDGQFLVLTYFLWLTDFCRVFTLRSFSQKLRARAMNVQLCIHLEE